MTIPDQPKQDCEHFWMPGGYMVIPKDYLNSHGIGRETEYHSASFLYCAKCLRTKRREEFGPSLFGPEVA